MGDEPRGGHAILNALDNDVDAARVAQQGPD
jgi:hypothetical protein